MIRPSIPGRPRRVLGFRSTRLVTEPPDEATAAAAANANLKLSSPLDEPYVRLRTSQHLAEMVAIHRGEVDLNGAHRRRDTSALSLLDAQEESDKRPLPSIPAGAPLTGNSRRVVARNAARSRNASGAVEQARRNLGAENLRLRQEADRVQRDLEARTAAFITELARYLLLANTARAAIASPALDPLPASLADDLVATAMRRPPLVNPDRTSPLEERS